MDTFLTRIINERVSPMWGPWRLTLRKAEHALKIGRLDEACRYVTRPEIRSFRQGRELAVRLAEAFACRAEEHLKHGDSQRAWIDIEQAAKLESAQERVGEVRQELVRQAVEEATQYLQAAQPATALATLERLTKRGVNAPDVRRLTEAAIAWQAGADLARRGKFADALLHLEKGLGLLPHSESIEGAVQQAWVGRDRILTLEPELHRALAAKEWSAVLTVADEILCLAPDHNQARAARRHAWRAVGAPVSMCHGGNNAVFNDHPLPGEDVAMLRSHDSPQITGDTPPPDPTDRPAPHQRFLLWIDGVGGYLVCTANRVSLGQPAGWHVDVPIMADLSRIHAWIERDGEGYMVRAGRPTSVDGMLVRDHVVLRDASIILLGSSTRLRFRRPSALSATALLEIESSHRLALAADAVLLMAETCIIGPKSHCHVVATNWKCEVVLYRHGDELWCRTQGTFEVDGHTVEEKAQLTTSSRVRGDGFSFALEPLMGVA